MVYVYNPTVIMHSIVRKHVEFLLVLKAIMHHTVVVLAINQAMRSVRIFLGWIDLSLLGYREREECNVLTILSHHTENGSVRFQFKRSGETVLKHFHRCCMLCCKYIPFSSLNLKQSLTIAHTQDGDGGLGALDMTYNDVHVFVEDKGRY
ncbi:hypothetical protein ACS0TY_021758 [Phlomoides rotata]